MKPGLYVSLRGQCFKRSNSLHLQQQRHQQGKGLQPQAHLDLDVLLEGHVQRLILLLQLVLGVQRVVCTLPEGDIDAG